MRRLGARASADEAIKTAMKEEMGDSYQWIEKIKSLGKMNGKAMMAMPFALTVQ
jgi:hypothetical protein